MSPKTKANAVTENEANAQLAAMAAKIEAMEAEAKAKDEKLARLEQEKIANISVKSAAKGGISVYGLGRFPVTLYSAQWERLFGMQEAIMAHAKEHGPELAFRASMAKDLAEQAKEQGLKDKAATDYVMNAVKEGWKALQAADLTDGPTVD
jgi:hypothetical protein